MRAKRYVALMLLAVIGLAACKEEEERPPPYSPVAVPESLVPCAALHSGAAQIDGTGAVRYDGGLAECFPVGIVCTVGPCDGGLGVARCIAGRWRWGCEPSIAPDAGQSDADAGQQDASLPEAAAEGG